VHPILLDGDAAEDLALRAATGGSFTTEAMTTSRCRARGCGPGDPVFGSWPSMLVWSGLIVVWIGYNGYVTTRYVGSAGFDPYALIPAECAVLLPCRLRCARDPVEPESHS
jgi:hypothetical protein